jgi:hypothetical protein
MRRTGVNGFRENIYSSILVGRRVI